MVESAVDAALAVLAENLENLLLLSAVVAPSAALALSAALAPSVVVALSAALAPSAVVAPNVELVRF
jgi:hypothetical protein